MLLDNQLVLLACLLTSGDSGRHLSPHFPFGLDVFLDPPSVLLLTLPFPCWGSLFPILGLNTHLPRKIHGRKGGNQNKQSGASAGMLWATSICFTCCLSWFLSLFFPDKRTFFFLGFALQDCVCALYLPPLNQTDTLYIVLPSFNFLLH